MIVEAFDDSSLSVEDADSLPTSVGAITDLASMVEDKDGLRRAVEASDVAVSKVLFSLVMDMLARSRMPHAVHSGDGRAGC
jgi:hypothetical protein